MSRDLSNWSLLDLASQIEHGYKFECAGGPLRNCIEWQELTKRILVLNRMIPDPNHIVDQKID